jgi:thioesterase domain-containing protein
MTEQIEESSPVNEETRAVQAEGPFLVPLQAKGQGPVVLFAPSCQMTASAFLGIAGKCGPDIPVYSFIWAESSGNTHPADTMEIISEQFLQETVDHGLTGPFVLGGYCFGAVIAIDMAVRLTGQGKEVPLVVLIDPVFPLTGTGQDTFVTGLVKKLRLFRKNGVRFFLIFHYRKMVYRFMMLRAPPRQKREYRMSAAHRRAFYRYRAVPFPGPAIILFSDADGNRGNSQHNTRDLDRWKTIFTGDLELVPLAGHTHHDVLITGSDEIARRIRTFLNVLTRQ